MCSVGKSWKGKEICFQIGLKNKVLRFYWHQNYLENLVGKQASRIPTSKFLSGRETVMLGGWGNGFYPWQKIGERTTDKWSRGSWVDESRTSKNHKISNMAHERA